MNILFFYQKKPYPPHCGGSNRVWNLAKTLVVLGNEVTIIFPGQKYRLEETIDGVRLISVPLSKRPLFKDYFYNPYFSLFFEFLKLEQKKKIDLIYCELFYLFPIVFLTKSFNKPIILDEFAVESESARLDYDLSLSSAKDLEWIKSAEKFAIDNSSVVLACSQVDALKFKQLYDIKDDKIKIVENGIDIASFDNIKPRPSKESIILFVGDSSYPPNKQAQLFLVEKVIPLVLYIIKDVQFVFITKSVPSFLKETKNIKVFSKVKDIKPFLRAAAVCLAPIFHGTGTRVKILEYMASRRAVISTKKGAEGLVVTNEKNILIRNSAQEFAEAIIDLVIDNTKRDLLGHQAYALIKQKYDILKIGKKLEDYHQNLKPEPIKDHNKILDFLSHGPGLWPISPKKDFKYYWTFVDRYIGMLGIFLKNNFPKLYFSLKKITKIFGL